MCLARYKTRPGLTYHYNHSHKERDLDSYNLGEPEDPESRDSRGVDSPSAGSDSLDGVPRVQVGQSAAQDEDRKYDRGPVSGKPGHTSPRPVYPQPGPATPPGPTLGKGLKKAGQLPVQHSKGSAQSSGYCDFCLGDSSCNKKSMQPEELIACSECGRSGRY